MFVTEHMRIDPAYRERLRGCGLDTVAGVLALVDGRVAAWSRTTDTLRVPGPDDGPGFYVKRYLFPTWTKRLRGTFRGTFFGQHRGRAEYRALNALRSAGVPAVRAVAWGERRVAHFLTACFLITEEVPDAENLTSFALEVVGGRRRMSNDQRNRLLLALAEHLALLHATGCSHGNLFWRNILVRDTPDGRPELFFLDPQPLRAWERWAAGVPWWLRELAQVAVSALPFTTRAERLRFIRRYVACSRDTGFDPPGIERVADDWKTTVRTVETLAAAWRRHEDRRIHMTRLFDEWNRQLVRETGRATSAVEPAP